MKTSLLPILRCPSASCDRNPQDVCGGHLVLDESAMDVMYGRNGELLQGALRCTKCGALHPVIAGVAIVVPDLQSYLFDNAAAMVVALSALPEDNTGMSEKTMETLRAMANASRVEDGFEGCLDVYLRSHYGGLRADDENGDALQSVVKSYVGGDFYDLQSGKLEESLGLPKGDMVGLGLDLGCGVGGMAWRMSRYCETVVGLDASFPAVLTARRLHGAQPCPLGPIETETEPGEYVHVEPPVIDVAENAEFIVASGMALPFDDGCACCAASMNLIDVLPSPALHAREAARVLLNGGTLHLTSPMFWNQEVLCQIGVMGLSSSDYLRFLAEDAGFALSAFEDAPWALEVNRRQANLYVCRSLTGQKAEAAKASGEEAR